MLIVSLPLSAAAKDVPQTNAQVQLSFAPLVKQVAPAVVNVYTKKITSKSARSPFMDDPFFSQMFGGNFFGGMRQHIESALGSGVIVSADGLIVTNAHVVRGAQEIRIILSDGNEHDARLVLSDDASDLALLRVKDEGVSLPFVHLKPSESLEVGDLVLAIGNPFGVGQTVTSGIVSAQGRSSLNVNDYNFFIQTDAAINPGNSGGPLVAMDGGVVGINTAIYSRSGGSLGIGFAIPSEMVASVIAAEMSGQTSDRGIIRPWFGVNVQDVTADIASSLNLNVPAGALISNLHSASPLNAAGMGVSDVVVAVNNHVIKNAAEMKFRLATVLIGQSAEILYIRNGREGRVNVKAVAPPEDPPREAVQLTGQHVLNGFVIGNINPAVSIELGLQTDAEGVVVMSAPRRGSFFNVLAVGDVLLEINGQKIENPKDVEKAMGAAGRSAEIVMKRGNRVTRVLLRN